MGGAGGHDHPQPRQHRRLRHGQGNGRVPVQRRLHGGDDLQRLAHAARAEFSAGHGAIAGADEEHAIAPQGRNIARGCRMQPHAQVHGRRRQHALVGGEQQRRGQIIGVAMGGLGEEVCGGGGDHHEVGVPRQLDMAHAGLGGERKQLLMNLLAAQARQRQGRDELGAGLRQHHAHAHPALAQAPHEVEALVGRYAAAHDQEDALARHAAPSLSPEASLRTRIASPRWPTRPHCPSGRGGPRPCR